MMSRAAAPLAFGLLFLVAWQGIVVFAQIPEYLLPAPTAIAASVDRSLAVQFMVTFIEALAGFVIASVLAFAVATMFVRYHALEDGLFPIAIAVKTTPIVAIAPLLVIWLGTGWWSKIVAAILICFFPVLVNTVKGLKAADLEYRELFETMGVPVLGAQNLVLARRHRRDCRGVRRGDTGPRLSHHHLFGASGNSDAVFGDLRRRVGRNRHVLRHRIYRTAGGLLVEHRSGVICKEHRSRSFASRPRGRAMYRVWCS
jgi:Binding-protein-dependent transport system inner membrane component